MGDDAAGADDPDFGGADFYREADVWPGRPGTDDEAVYAGFFRADVWLGDDAAGADDPDFGGADYYREADVRSAHLWTADVGAVDSGNDGQTDVRSGHVGADDEAVYAGFF